MTPLKIAIQKSGRLNEDSLRLLKSCGISVDNGRDQLKVSVQKFSFGNILPSKLGHPTILGRWRNRYRYSW